MELSTAASFTAAVISLITLVVTTYFTGRRERVKWAREALAEAFYDFVNISYAASDALHHHQKQLWAGAGESSLQASADEVSAQILALRHAQTKIRLLAPARTVNLANEVRFRVKDAVQAASPTTTAEQHEQDRVIIAEARARLLGSAKKYMALPR
jgi:MoxR-like ATPase